MSRWLTCQEQATLQGASDVFFSVGNPPMMSMQGALRALADEPVLSFEDVSVALDGMMSEQQRRYFSESADLDFAFQSTKLGRFRVGAFQHHRAPGVVLRVLAHAPHPLNNWLSQTQWPSLCLLTGLTSSVV